MSSSHNRKTLKTEKPILGTVVVVGSINIDQVVSVNRHPLPGETLIGNDLELLPGGKGANQAVAAASLGGKVALVGAVGDDSTATAAMAILIASGVDTVEVETVEGPTGLALITVCENGENTIVVVPGANAFVDKAFVHARQALVASACVVVLQGEIPRSGIMEAARLAQGRVLLNLAPVIKLDEATLHLADPLVVNEHEASLLLNLLKPGTDFPGADRKIAQELLDWGMKSVVLTRGAKGALCVDDSGTLDVAAPVVTARDTSGAGDAFVGALSLKLAAGQSLQDAVRYAVRVGAFAVQSRGTQPSYPRVGDLLPQSKQ
ncbi:ribokinase [Arthrobacter cryoconiti]|uniref:Ribokinase n=1 Tax=Arthrobacter cryoconiti TaxID=748907 RepID=A0ABV8R2J4_9MICC|nr:ribokinase [Arthrobacter cryoconiti]MCC9069260.1 ribokinase [Arthrobacter cryoconiti]